MIDKSRTTPKASPLLAFLLFFTLTMGTTVINHLTMDIWWRILALTALSWVTSWIIDLIVREAVNRP